MWWRGGVDARRVSKETKPPDEKLGKLAETVGICVSKGNCC